MSDANQVKKQKKLFGVSHPLGKAILLILFVIFTGGLGLIAVLLAYWGDKKLEKRKQCKVNSHD